MRGTPGKIIIILDYQPIMYLSRIRNNYKMSTKNITIININRIKDYIT